MMFRNVTFFHLAALNTKDLEARLQENALKPVGKMELTRSGFIPPMPDDDRIARVQDGFIGITLGTQSRLLPSAVVAERVKAEAARLEKQTGQKPGRGALRSITETVTAELLPQAFVVSSNLDAIIDTRTGFVAVDTAARAAAEKLISNLHDALGTFPALPVNVGIAHHPYHVMTGWAAGDPLPDGFELSDSLDLVDPADSGATVKMRHHLPHCEEAQTHIEAGKFVTRLAMEYRNRCRFVIDDALVLRQFKLLDAAAEELPSDTDSLAAEVLARFTLTAGELRALFPALCKAFQVPA